MGWCVGAWELGRREVDWGGLGRDGANSSVERGQSSTPGSIYLINAAMDIHCVTNHNGDVPFACAGRGSDIGYIICHRAAA